MKLKLLALCLLSGSVFAHEPGDKLPNLTPYESGVILGMVHAANQLSAVHIDRGYLRPYICSHSWDIRYDWLPVVEWDVRHHIAHTPPKDRQNFPLGFYTWWVMLDRLGCGDWNPPFGDWKDHD